jgi:hypothetical protein
MPSRIRRAALRRGTTLPPVACAALSVCAVAIACATSPACVAAGEPPRAPAVAPPAYGHAPSVSAAAGASSTSAPGQALDAPPGTRASRRACEPLVVELPEIDADASAVPVPPIEDAQDRVMAPLYERLAGIVRGTATDHVRIGIYGDSNMTMDWITGAMRRQLQARWGDAGHGFIAVGKPWNWYHHMDARHGLWERAWTSYAVSTNGVLDGMYGFAGIAAQSMQVGATAWVETAPETSPVGRTASSFDVYFVRAPGNGAFALRLDGELRATIDTHGAPAGADFHRLEVPDAPHKLEMVTVGPKPVRLLGVALERGRPSVVVDSLGIGGAGIQTLTKENAEVTRQTLRRRKYDLVGFLFGTNSWDLEHQGEAVRKVAERHREALPHVALLVMSPPDHAKPSEPWRSDPWTVKVAKLLRQNAAESGCAFWDFRAAMGGDGAIIRFRNKGGRGRTSST